MFEQYVASVDPKFTDDIQSVRANLDKPVDPVDFSDQERQKPFPIQLAVSTSSSMCFAGGQTSHWQ